MLYRLNDTFFEAFGALFTRFLRGTGSMTLFWCKALAASFGRWNYRLTMDQALRTGVRSLPVALLTALFVGMVGNLSGGVQLQKFGAKNYVPSMSFIANAREMIPVFISFVVGARVTASIAAEIGTMKVTEQLDAMEILNVDAMKYLVAPRVVATTLMLPLIIIVCLYMAFFGGMAVGASALNIPPSSYYAMSMRYAYLSDIYFGLFKGVVFGNIIAVTGCYFGFNTHGGAEGVGRSTTTSVVVTLMLILLFNFIMTRWFIIISPYLY